MNYLKRGVLLLMRIFLKKGEYGYTNSVNEEYTSWKLRSRMFIEKFFGENSDVITYFDKNLTVRILGNGEEEFQEFHDYMLGALRTAIDILEIDSNLIENTLKTDRKIENSKVFIVHGHDEELKKDVEIFLSEIGIEAIVLHRQADEGQTIIEKFEKHSDVGYAFVLLTPDDIAYHASEDEMDDIQRTKYYRARQNVIFEFGYFLGKLGRKRVCCLYKENVEVPSDLAGMIYKKVSQNVEEVAFQIIKDLRAVGYELRI